MQVSRVELDEKTAYQFAKLRMVYGKRSAQRTFDEALIAAWYMITQNAVPPRLEIPQEEPTAIETVFNFELVGEGYIQMFVEIKRRLSLGKVSRATNLDTVEHVIKRVFVHYDKQGALFMFDN